MRVQNALGLCYALILSFPVDKEIIAGVGLVIGIIVVFLTFISSYLIAMILEWSIMKKDLNFKSQELENENLKLKQQEQALPDQDE